MSENIITIQCCNCKKVKPLDSFHKNASKKYGHTNICKPCNIIRIKLRPRTEARRATTRRSVKKYQRKHPERKNAHSFVHLMIFYGKILHPSKCKCLICNAIAQEYHHPFGYDWENCLNIIPICKICHYKIHNVLASGKGKEDLPLP